MTSLEIIDKKNQIKKEIESLVFAAKSEERKLTNDEENTFDAKLNELKELDKSLEEIQRNLENNNNNNTKHTSMKEFRLLTAINEIVNHRQLSEENKNFIELGAEEMRKAGLNTNGQIQLPVEKRATIAATVVNQGKENVGLEMEGILEPLRAKNVLIQAGAKFMTGLRGDVAVPVMSAANVSWEGESAPAKDGNIKFTQVKLSPKRITAYVDVTKQFLAQDSNDAEMIIRNDLVNAINTKLEQTIFGEGVGSTTEPAGLFKTPASAATADFKALCDIEAKVADANVMGECKYIMSNKAKAVFRNMPKSAKTTQLVMESNMIDGTPVLSSSNVAKTNFVYGDFSQLCIAQWGSIDVQVDPYTKATDGVIRLVVNAYFDIKPLRADALVIGKV